MVIAMMLFLKRVFFVMMFVMMGIPQIASAQQTRFCSYQCQNSANATDVRAPLNVTQPGTCTFGNDCQSECRRVCADPNQHGLGAGTWTCKTDTLTCGGGGNVGTIYDPFARQDVPTVINTIIRFLLGFVGALFLAMFVYGGILWFTAAGDEGRVKSAKNALSNAVIGMTITMLSYGLVSVLLQYISTINPLEDQSVVQRAESGAQAPASGGGMTGGPSDPGTEAAPDGGGFTSGPLPAGVTGVSYSASNCQTACVSACPSGTNAEICRDGCTVMCVNEIVNRLPSGVANCQSQCPAICGPASGGAELPTSLRLAFGTNCEALCRTSCSAAVTEERAP